MSVGSLKARGTYKRNNFIEALKSVSDKKKPFVEDRRYEKGQ